MATLEAGTLVEVYWNRTRRCWSIRHAGTHRVIGHAKQVLLADAHMVVRARGRERFLRTGSRTVHAWVRGTLVDSLVVPHRYRKPLTYDPAAAPAFTNRRTKKVITTAQGVVARATPEGTADMRYL